MTEERRRSTRTRKTTAKLKALNKSKKERNSKKMARQKKASVEEKSKASSPNEEEICSCPSLFAVAESKSKSNVIVAINAAEGKSIEPVGDIIIPEPEFTPLQMYDLEQKAFNVFERLKYDSKSKLPTEPVLQTDPDSESQLTKCPRLLWHFIHLCGGFLVKGQKLKDHVGINRGKINRLLNKWKVLKFGSRAIGEVPVMRREVLMSYIDKLVPSTKDLVDQLVSYHPEHSSVLALRPKTKSIKVFQMNGADIFWDEQRKNIIDIFLDCAQNNYKKKWIVTLKTHQGNHYKKFEDLLQKENKNFSDECDFCNTKCTCINCLSWEVNDMFTFIVLNTIVPRGKQKLISPNNTAQLPKQSEDSVYNIAGAMLQKILKTYPQFTPFVNHHSIGKENAKNCNLPVDKVIQKEFDKADLNYASSDFYQLLCSIELLYFINFKLLEHDAYEIENIMNDIAALAKENAGVKEIWMKCTRDVAVGSDFNFETLFNILNTYFRNMRAKEYRKNSMQTTARQIARLSGVRDRTAAIQFAATATAKKEINLIINAQ
eukprot:g2510.t1